MTRGIILVLLSFAFVAAGCAQGDTVLVTANEGEAFILPNPSPAPTPASETAPSTVQPPAPTSTPPPVPPRATASGDYCTALQRYARHGVVLNGLDNTDIAAVQDALEGQVAYLRAAGQIAPLAQAKAVDTVLNLYAEYVEELALWGWNLDLYQDTVAPDTILEFEQAKSVILEYMSAVCQLHSTGEPWSMPTPRPTLPPAVRRAGLIDDLVEIGLSPAQAECVVTAIAAPSQSTEPESSETPFLECISADEYDALLMRLMTLEPYGN